VRGAVLLVLLLLLATGLAGCERPHIAIAGKEPKAATEPRLEMPKPFDLSKGHDIGTIPAPVWKPGYHFTYSEAGARDVQQSGKAYQLNHTASETVSWGPRQAGNYTVVHVDESPFGETTYLALHTDDDRALGDGPELLAFRDAHLDALDAGIATRCNSQFNCTPYASIHDEASEAPILSFPLRDGPAKREDAPWVSSPWVPTGPLDVVTRVLGLKEVDGPFGPVQAVHVHQDVLFNITDLLRDAEPAAEAGGVTDLAFNGTMRASRDVFYAPSLLNVVLDQAVSEGTLVQSYRESGHNQSFTQTWRSWQTVRLTAATYDPSPPLSLLEVYAVLRSGGAFATQGIHLDLDPSVVSIADGESTVIRVVDEGATRASRVRIDVWSPEGVVLASTEGRSMTFTPLQVDPYLVVASAYGADGRLLDRSYRSLAATYQGEVQVECALVVDAATSCPGVELPYGSSISSLDLVAVATDGSSSLPVPTPARLAIDMGDGQEISSDAQSGIAVLHVDYPFMRQPWTARYRPDVAVAMTVSFTILVWPGWMPSSVYLAAAQSP
jgi:hypothetical protein